MPKEAENYKILNEESLTNRRRMPHCLYRLVVWADPCLCLPGKIRRETYAGLPYYNREECLHCARSKKHVPTNDLEEGVHSAVSQIYRLRYRRSRSKQDKKVGFWASLFTYVRMMYTGKGLKMTSTHTRVFRHQPLQTLREKVPNSCSARRTKRCRCRSGSTNSPSLF